MDKPTPGSFEAVADGCLCPIIDNNYGKGACYGKDGKMIWWTDDDCPVHKSDAFGGVE